MPGARVNLVKLASEASPQTDKMYGHMDAMDAMDNYKEEDRHGGLSHDMNWRSGARLDSRTTSSETQ